MTVSITAAIRTPSYSIKGHKCSLTTLFNYSTCNKIPDKAFLPEPFLWIFSFILLKTKRFTEMSFTLFIQSKNCPHVRCRKVLLFISSLPACEWCTNNRKAHKYLTLFKRLVMNRWFLTDIINVVFDNIGYAFLVNTDLDNVHYQLMLYETCFPNYSFPILRIPHGMYDLRTYSLAIFCYGATFKE